MVEAARSLDAAEKAVSERGGIPAALARDVGRLRKDVRRFQRFGSQSEAAIERLVHGPEEQGMDLARKALSVYHVLNHHDWVAKLDRSSLDENHIAWIRRTVYELLVLMAEQRMRYLPSSTWGDEQERNSAARDGLRYLEKAAEAHAPTRVFYYLRTRCWPELGKRKEQEADARRLEQAQATVALDYFIAAQDASWRHGKEGRAEAIRLYRAALRLEPQHYPSLWCMASVLHATNRHAEAVIAYTGCSLVRPDSYLIYYNRALSHMKLGYLDEASADLDQAVNLAEASLPAQHRIHFLYFQRGKLRTRLGSAEEGLSDFAKAVEDSPSAYWCEPFPADADNDQLWIEYDKRAKERIKPEAQALHVRACHIWIPEDRHDQAIADFNKAIEIDPDNPDYYWHRARCYEALNDDASALLDWDRALELGMDWHDRLNELAWFLATAADPQLRDPKQAVELGKKAVELAPDEANYWNTLGVAHCRDGDWKAAIAALEKSIDLTWSPDGSEVAFAMQHQEQLPDGTTHLSFKLLADDADPATPQNARTIVGPNQFSYILDPDWSNSQAVNQIAFGTPKTLSKSDGLYVVDASGANSPVKLSSDIVPSPSWSPDDRFLALYGSAGNKRGIVKLELATGRKTLLASEGGKNMLRMPDWRPSASGLATPSFLATSQATGVEAEETVIQDQTGPLFIEAIARWQAAVWLEHAVDGVMAETPIAGTRRMPDSDEHGEMLAALDLLYKELGASWV